MARQDLSRREFVAVAVAAGGVLAARPVAGRQSAVTAADLIARVRANLGVPWRDGTADGLKAGDLSTSITGVAVTVTPTLDVLRRAASSKRNLVIVREPVFYTPNDDPGPRANDPAVAAKQALIAEHRLVIYRLAEHWQRRRPQPDAAALATRLGWTTSGAESDLLFETPPLTLSALADHVGTRLGARGGVRVVGRASLAVRRVCVIPATTSMPAVLEHIGRADVVIAGEPREWEVVPYLADTVTSNQPKGLVVVGRLLSQEPGVVAQAEWMRKLVPEIPVEVLSAGDPYWSPRS